MLLCKCLNAELCFCAFILRFILQFPKCATKLRI
nr:MAG TPA: hypothetical protein [Caudoviricetes sp.]